MTAFINWLKNLLAHIHLLLGKLTRLAFYLGLAYIGWRYLRNANITGTTTEQITIGQIFGVLIGAGILLIALFAFFHFPDEINPLAEDSLYRSIWGNFGIFIIIVCVFIYGWLSFYNHFDRPFWERVSLLYNDQSTRIEKILNEVFK